MSSSLELLPEQSRLYIIQSRRRTLEISSSDRLVATHTNGFPVCPNSMQILASEISRSITYTIPGGTA